MAKLTDATVRALPAPDRGNKVTYEGGGFGVRVTAAGAKSFVLNYRAEGRERRITIGPWPAWGVAVARKEAGRLRQLADAGEDPLAERQRRRDADTIEELAERYIDEHARPKKRSWRQDERRLAKYVLPVWRSRKIEDVRRQDVSELVAKIAKATPVEANRILTLVSTLFSFAVDAGLIENHPCLRMAKPTKEEPRERALKSNAELQMVWEITGGGDWADTIPPREAAAIRLLLLTGARVSEVAEMAWSEVDLDAAEWTLPAARHKGNRVHLVPLSPEAVAILRELPRTGAYVFSGARGGPLTKKHVSSALIRASERLAERGIEKFTPHDLRRTVETGLAALKVPKEYRDRVLGHVDGSVGGRHYNKHDYADEKREALDKWQRHVLAIIGGDDNVIQFPARSA